MYTLLKAASCLLFLNLLISHSCDALEADEIFRIASPAVVQIIAKTPTEERLGTGFFITADGTVVTNHHVVSDATEISVVLATKASFTIERILATDEESDLALLKVRGEGLPFLKVFSGDTPSIGTKVYAIGSPQGLTNTISDGILSGIRKIDDTRIVLQVTVPISSGSSGGPLLDIQGRVVGVTTAFLVEGQNLNFCVAARDIENLVTSASQSSNFEDTLLVPIEVWEALTQQLAGEDPKWIALMKEVKTRPSDANSYIDRASYALNGLFIHPKFEYNARSLALSDCSYAIKLDPNNAAAYKLRCEAFMTMYQGRIDKDMALLDLERYMAVAPKTVESHLFASDVYFRVGHSPKGIAAIQDALLLNPSSGDAYLKRAYYYVRVKDLTKALADCKRVIEISEKCSDNWIRSCRLQIDAHLARSDSESALEASESVIQCLLNAPDKDDANRAHAFERHGELLVLASRHRDAIESFSSAIDAFKLLYKDIIEAARDLDKKNGRHSDDRRIEGQNFATAYIGRARSYAAIKEDKKAIEDYSVVLFDEEFPNQLPALFPATVVTGMSDGGASIGDIFQERGQSWFRLGNFDNAINDLMESAYRGTTLDTELLQALREKGIDLSIIEDRDRLDEVMERRFLSRIKEFTRISE